MAEQLTYKDSGVDIDAGNYSVKLIKDSVKATYRPEVLGDLGGFGGLFALNSGKYKEPVLVSGTDGVGTKLRLAFMLDKHDTIGQDAVAMCVNDILVRALSRSSSSTTSPSASSTPSRSHPSSRASRTPAKSPAAPHWRRDR